MIELLRSRRSIRQYLDRAIEPEKVELLKEAVLRSPSSRNIDPWEFIFVDDRDTLARLAVCKPHGARFLEHAPLGIVGTRAWNDVSCHRGRGRFDPALPDELCHAAGGRAPLSQRCESRHRSPTLSHDDLLAALHGVKVPAQVGLEDADRGLLHNLTIIDSIINTRWSFRCVAGADHPNFPRDPRA